MIKAYLDKKKHPKAFGCNIEDIEGYDDAVASPELYVIHHVLEWKYTSKELISMNRYWDVDPSELIFVPASLHLSSKFIHKGKLNSLRALKHEGHESGITHSMNSTFGKLFYEHFGIHFIDDKKLYRRERAYYLNNHKCRWEV